MQSNVSYLLLDPLSCSVYFALRTSSCSRYRMHCLHESVFLRTSVLHCLQVRLMAKEHLGRYKNTFDCLTKV